MDHAGHGSAQALIMIEGRQASTHRLRQILCKLILYSLACERIKQMYTVGLNPDSEKLARPCLYALAEDTEDVLILQSQSDLCFRSHGLNHDHLSKRSPIR